MISDNDLYDWVRKVDMRCGVKAGPPMRVVVRQPDGSEIHGDIIGANPEADSMTLTIAVNEMREAVLDLGDREVIMVKGHGLIVVIKDGEPDEYQARQLVRVNGREYRVAGVEYGIIPLCVGLLVRPTEDER